jgi:hypothetical protein
MSTFLERLTAIVDDYGQPAELGATPEDYMPSTRSASARRA